VPRPIQKSRSQSAKVAADFLKRQIHGEARHQAISQSHCDADVVRGVSGTCPPLKCPSHRGSGIWIPSVPWANMSLPQTGSESAHLFLQGLRSSPTNRQTDRQTHHAISNIGSIILHQTHKTSPYKAERGLRRFLNVKKTETLPTYSCQEPVVSYLRIIMNDCE